MKEGPSRSANRADLRHRKLLLVDELQRPCVQRRHHADVPLITAQLGDGHAGAFISAA
jgi:hypothetical protein